MTVTMPLRVPVYLRVGEVEEQQVATLEVPGAVLRTERRGQDLEASLDIDADEVQRQLARALRGVADEIDPDGP